MAVWRTNIAMTSLATKKTGTKILSFGTARLTLSALTLALHISSTLRRTARRHAVSSVALRGKISSSLSHQTHCFTCFCQSSIRFSSKGISFSKLLLGRIIGVRWLEIVFRPLIVVPRLIPIILPSIIVSVAAICIPCCIPWIVWIPRTVTLFPVFTIFIPPNSLLPLPARLRFFLLSIKSLQSPSDQRKTSGVSGLCENVLLLSCPVSFAAFRCLYPRSSSSKKSFTAKPEPETPSGGSAGDGCDSRVPPLWPPCIYAPVVGLCDAETAGVTASSDLDALPRPCLSSRARALHGPEQIAVE